MSSRTGTKTGTTESPMAIHHLVTGGFTSKNIQTIDKMTVIVWYILSIV